jgi:hypothetical protein
VEPTSGGAWLRLVVMRAIVCVKSSDAV